MANRGSHLKEGSIWAIYKITHLGAEIIIMSLDYERLNTTKRYLKSRFPVCEYEIKQHPLITEGQAAHEKMEQARTASIL